MTVQTRVASEPRVAIPRLIKRNTLYLTAAEAFVGTGQQMVPTLTAIIVVQFLHSATLGGIGMSILGASRLVVGYPAGQLADTRGRKPVLLLGLVVSLVGALGIGLAVLANGFWVFLAGLVLFGLGSGASQNQRRLAAADLYPASRRGEGLGYVLMGALVGALGGPILVSSGGAIAHAAGVSALAVPWLLVSVVVLPSIILILLIHPEPMEIALHLGRYWPIDGEVDETRPAPATQGASSLVTPCSFFRRLPLLVAIVGLAGANGTMVLLMALTPLAMAARGVALSVISLSVAIHVAGMFGFSVPLGRLADRIGRRGVLGMGLLLEGLGALLVPASMNQWVMTAGLFLVGLGWSGANVATAALLADATQPDERGRAMGVQASVSAAGSIAVPLLGGLAVELWGSWALSIMGIALLAGPALLLLRLAETGVKSHVTDSPATVMSTTPQDRRYGRIGRER